MVHPFASITPSPMPTAVHSQEAVQKPDHHVGVVVWSMLGRVSRGFTARPQRRRLQRRRRRCRAAARPQRWRGPRRGSQNPAERAGRGAQGRDGRRRLDRPCTGRGAAGRGSCSCEPRVEGDRRGQPDGQPAQKAHGRSAAGLEAVGARGHHATPQSRSRTWISSARRSFRRWKRSAFDSERTTGPRSGSGSSPGSGSKWFQAHGSSSFGAGDWRM